MIRFEYFLTYERGEQGNKMFIKVFFGLPLFWMDLKKIY